MPRWTKAFFIVLALFAATGAVAVQARPVWTPSPQKATGKLSFRLAALSSSASLRAAGTIDQASALSLPSAGPGSLVRSGKQIQVEARLESTAKPVLQALQAAGAQILHASAQYQTADLLIDPARLAALAALPQVLHLNEQLTPQTGRQPGAPILPAIPAWNLNAPTFTCPQGANVSEGDTHLTAASARSAYSLDGTGIKVGILSDSYNKSTAVLLPTAVDDVASGDLPGGFNPCSNNSPVIIQQEYTSAGSDEGRGMLQIVHDLVPSAQLSFATAFISLTSFADNIRALRNTVGADIIADDVFYFSEPFFQEGPVNVAISDVVADGGMYFTLAGNHNLILSGKNISSYEAAAYRPTACPAVLINSPYSEFDCHDFSPNGLGDNAELVTVGSGGKLVIDLQWSEPWNGVDTDLDLYLLNAAMDTVVAYSYDNNVSSSFIPFEYISQSLTPGNYYLVIARYSGSSTPRLKYIFLQGTYNITALEYTTSSGSNIIGPTLYGHSATTSGISVGAVPFSSTTAPETFTARGPATHYFGPVINTTPATAITPRTMNQPDIAATDGGCTTFFGSYSSSFIPNCFRFYGTSAAAPHAAAVAALILQEERKNSHTPNQTAMLTMLKLGANPVGTGNTTAVGAGLIQAYQSIQKVIAISNGSKVYLPMIKR